MSGPVLLFDLDDTLFAHRDAVRAGFAAHLAAQPHLTVADLEGELDRWHVLEEQHYSRYLSGELDWHGQRRARADEFLAPYGVTLADAAATEEWFEQYFDRYRAAWTLHDDVLPCLDALPGARVGIITNGELPTQSEKVAAVGFTGSVEHLIASGSVGVTKPDPAIFRLACERFGVPPAEAWYIGDRFETDAVGATRAGLTGVWIDRHGAATEGELRRAAELGIPVITSLAELPALVG